MYLIEIFLPLNDNDGQRLPAAVFVRVRDELSSKFGGLTAFTRAPAHGIWQPDKASAPARDEIVIYEVMSPTLDRLWWQDYRRDLESLFRQEKILMRATLVEML
jgi:hypothetical protein